MSTIDVTLKEVADPIRLKLAWTKIKKKGSIGGVDGVTISSFNANLEVNLSELSNQILTNQYTPEPLQAAHIPKPGKSEKRQLGLPSLKDKIVQSSLASILSDFYEIHFSNCSYAYRPGKGSVKAIGRVRDFLNRKNYWIASVDIDNFFDSVDHEICTSILKEQISDQSIIRLISLYFSSGMIKFDQWQDTEIGIPQGGAISPVISNIYLNKLDHFLHTLNAFFVRYADDIILFSNTQQSLSETYQKTNEFLNKKLNLKLNALDNPIINVSKGFSFLGIYFHRCQLKIDFKRIDEKIEKMKYIIHKQKQIDAVIKEINEFFNGVQRHYGNIIPDSYQLKNLESTVLDELSIFLAKMKNEGHINSKKACKLVLDPLVFMSERTKSQRDAVIDKIIADAFTIVDQKKDTDEKRIEKSVDSAIHQKRQAYAKKIATETELIITKFGHPIGYTKHKFTVRHKGQIVASIPKNRLKRIAIKSTGVSLSSNLIYQCCTRNIAIEFFSNNGETYAMIYTPQRSISQSSEVQLKARNDKKGSKLAYYFIKGKAKNQINMIKYFNKYLKKTNPENSKIIEHNIQQMDKLYESFQLPENMDRKDVRDRLMGTEGIISQHYWEAVKLIIPVSVGFERRVTRGAKDLFNSCLNYGYGILYNRVQKALADAGAALHISFLHEPNNKKPTLVYDLIEEFRQFVIDRTIVVLFNRNEPLSTDKKALLTMKSRQLIALNVQERLSSYTTWRGRRWKCEDIIYHQARLIMHYLNDEKKYRPFLGRY
ncbi:cRISPR-associated endonuclease Cas1 [Candidatus Magnetomorum sp. HK-1]|nr:cRISPR-associated endonuclease Cas1 [Candidatus Magnetomorum sp. HK-1]